MDEQIFWPLLRSWTTRLITSIVEIEFIWGSRTVISHFFQIFWGTQNWEEEGGLPIISIRRPQFLQSIVEIEAVWGLRTMISHFSSFQSVWGKNTTQRRKGGLAIVIISEHLCEDEIPLVHRCKFHPAWVGRWWTLWGPGSSKGFPESAKP